MVEGYTPPETGPVYWDVAPHSLLADLLIWASVGYALAAVVARARLAQHVAQRRRSFKWSKSSATWACSMT